MTLTRRALLQYETSASVLAAVRQRSGLSLRDLAREIGVPPSTIHRLEHGKDVSARAYTALMLWAALNNPNVAV